MMYKKMLAKILCLVMLSCLMLPFSAHAALQGGGTEKNPFLATDMQTLRMIADFPDAYWKLANDIELSGTWTMLGYTSSAMVPFTGVLDGDGYKITGLYQNQADYAGFLGINEGTIKNLHVEGTITVSDDYQNSLFAYINRGTIENCSAKGSLNASTTASWTHVSGGLVSHNEATGIIRNCYSRVDMKQRTHVNAQYVGGLVGENAGTVENCYAAAAMEDSHKGLVGKSASGGKAVSSYYDKDLSGCTDTTGGAAGKSTAAMKLPYTYAGWDFETVWAIDASVNDGYPYLQNEKSVVVKATGMTLAQNRVTLQEGETVTLIPIFTPPNATNQTVTWKTTSRYVASVTNTGVVAGVAEGTATITAVAEDGGFEATCEVTVVPASQPEPDQAYTVAFSSSSMPQSGKFRAEVRMTKNTDQQGGVLVIAMYDQNGNMADYLFLESSFEQGKSYLLGGTLDALPGGQLKAFVWKSLSDMTPVSNIAEL